MGKWFNRLRANARLGVQIAFTALSNGYVQGFARGEIYTGPSKAVCLPGLNCYSCPGALGACPLGSLQAVLGSRGHWFAFYVVGFLMIVGALVGRFVCGWLCPFGLVQDLLHKIPFPKKLRRLPGENVLRSLKYILLIGFVILLPLFAVDAFGQGQPWFCKYVCPSGTLLGGVPLLSANEGLRAAAGWLFAWKGALLAVLLVLSILLYRPFCRYLCPLGVIYGFFNKIALLRYRVDAEKCTACGVCQRTCPMDIPTYKTPNSAACIRCGACVKACPHRAIGTTLGRREAPAAQKRV
nr:4Fe-4S binding protein [Maliibacterium massiliense]